MYLDDLELDSLVRLRALEAVADGFHQTVDQPLAGASAVRSVTRDVTVRDQLLQTDTGRLRGQDGRLFYACALLFHVPTETHFHSYKKKAVVAESSEQINHTDSLALTFNRLEQ